MFLQEPLLKTLVILIHLFFPSSGRSLEKTNAGIVNPHLRSGTALWASLLLSTMQDAISPVLQVQRSSHRVKSDFSRVI